MMAENWTSRGERLRLTLEGEVHVWRVCISQEKGNEQRWRDVLARNELLRADHFHFDKDRDTFTVTRGVLRTLLGYYLDLTPKAVTLTFNEFGKPALAPQRAQTGVKFNVAHSGDYSLLAFGVGMDLGVDIEYLSIARNVVELAKTVLSPSEYLLFINLPRSDREKAFLQMWARKEALVKAVGCGLAIPLDSFEVTFCSDKPDLVLFGARKIIDSTDWSFRDIAVHEDYVSALAARRRTIDLRLWDWK